MTNFTHQRNQTKVRRKKDGEVNSPLHRTNKNRRRGGRANIFQPPESKRAEGTAAWLPGKVEACVGDTASKRFQPDLQFVVRSSGQEFLLTIGRRVRAYA
jgi:hypothetical protein